MDDTCTQLQKLEIRAREAAARLNLLTGRQRQVFEHVVVGLRNKQIGYLLEIDEKTVKMHRAGALKRLGESTAGAIRLFVEARYAVCFDRSAHDSCTVAVGFRPIAPFRGGPSALEYVRRGDGPSGD